MPKAGNISGLAMAETVSAQGALANINAPHRNAGTRPQSEASVREPFDTFLRQLRERQVSGAAAREAIINRLSTMTVAELRKVRASTIGRLGPQGVVKFMELSAALRAAGAGVAPASIAQPMRKLDQQPLTLLSLFKDWQQRQPLPWQVFVAFVMRLVIAVVLVIATPLTWRAVMDTGSPGEPRLCRQLDRWTGDCRYRAGSPTFTPVRAAALLHLPLDTLLMANPHLAAETTIPPGTSLIVPRRPGLNLR